MRYSNVYVKKKFGNVSSETLKICWKNFNNILSTFREGLGFGVRVWVTVRVRVRVMVRVRVRVRFRVRVRIRVGVRVRFGVGVRVRFGVMVRFGVWDLVFAVVNIFSYLCVVATYMNIKNSEM